MFNDNINLLSLAVFYLISSYLANLNIEQIHIERSGYYVIIFFTYTHTTHTHTHTHTRARARTHTHTHTRTHTHTHAHTHTHTHTHTQHTHNTHTRARTHISIYTRPHLVDITLPLTLHLKIMGHMISMTTILIFRPEGVSNLSDENFWIIPLGNACMLNPNRAWNIWIYTPFMRRLYHLTPQNNF